jgi:predicted transcriptional regulator
MTNTYLLSIEDQVIQHMRNGNQSITQLVERIGVSNVSYHTVRTVVYDLLDRNILILAGYKNRHQIFKLNPDKDEMSTIPFLREANVKEQRKAYVLLQSVGNESRMAAVSSVRNLPRHMTDLFNLALIYKRSKTKAPVDPALGALRESMQNDLIKLKKIVNLYEQVLAHPKFWNEQTLRDMAFDKDFDDEEVLAANSYYESQTQDAPQFQSPLE